MRPSLTPEQFRAAGIYLNAGRRRGWRKRLAQLLNTPEATIAAWASRTPGNARSIPGAVAVALRLLVVMVRQKELSEGDLPLAAQVVADQVMLLLRMPEFIPPVTECATERVAGRSAERRAEELGRRASDRPGDQVSEPLPLRPDGPAAMTKLRGPD
ncbi:MAG: hypothetical protein ACFCUQ_05585 [Kiloniellales bacterium]